MSNHNNINNNHLNNSQTIVDLTIVKNGFIDGFTEEGPELARPRRAQSCPASYIIDDVGLPLDLPGRADVAAARAQMEYPNSWS
eukprot:12478225-Heterocapsa_arctica.AAC.1